MKSKVLTARLRTIARLEDDPIYSVCLKIQRWDGSITCEHHRFTHLVEASRFAKVKGKIRKGRPPK